MSIKLFRAWHDPMREDKKKEEREEEIKKEKKKNQCDKDPAVKSGE